MKNTQKTQKKIDIQKVEHKFMDKTTKLLVVNIENILSDFEKTFFIEQNMYGYDHIKKMRNYAIKKAKAFGFSGFRHTYKNSGHGIAFETENIENLEKNILEMRKQTFEKMPLKNPIYIYVNSKDQYKKIKETQSHEEALVNQGIRIDLKDFKDLRHFKKFCNSLFPKNESGLVFGYHKNLPTQLLDKENCPTIDCFRYIQHLQYLDNNKKILDTLIQNGFDFDAPYNIIQTKENESFYHAIGRYKYENGHIKDTDFVETGKYFCNSLHKKYYAYLTKDELKPYFNTDERNKIIIEVLKFKQN